MFLCLLLLVHLSVGWSSIVSVVSYQDILPNLRFCFFFDFMPFLCIFPLSFFWQPITNFVVVGLFFFGNAKTRRKKR
jgi:hypothetical protein